MRQKFAQELLGWDFDDKPTFKFARTGKELWRRYKYLWQQLRERRVRHGCALQDPFPNPGPNPNRHGCALQDLFRQKTGAHDPLRTNALGNLVGEDGSHAI